MKRFFFLMLLGGLVSCKPEPGDQEKKEEIRNLLADYYGALAKKDLSKMNDLTTADFVLFDKGVIYTNENAGKAAEHPDSIIPTFKFDSLNIHFDKANASAYYFREASFSSHDSTHSPIRFLESATFEKQNGKWRLRFLHSSERQ